MLLLDLPIDTYGKITDIHTNGEDRRRFLDLGMIVGTKIKPILKSPSGDPTAYEVRGSIIALRQEAAEKIGITIE